MSSPRPIHATGTNKHLHGLFLQSCGRDSWLVYQGYNRCECGAYLWIEKGEADDSGHRYRHHQGPALPDGYRGWMQVTD